MAIPKSESVSKVDLLNPVLSICKFSFKLPLQTSTKGAALKSPSGDLGVQMVTGL